MSFDAIKKDDYGQVAKITFLDVDTNAATDISGYSTTKHMIFTDPSGTETTVTAAFDTDGTNGVIRYKVASGLLDEAGAWMVRGKVTSATATLSTLNHMFQVY
jgi:hypothetical protein